MTETADKSIVTLSVDALSSTPDKAQKFFAELAAEARKPHYGGQSREWMQALLIRAETEGLYTPEKS